MSTFYNYFLVVVGWLPLPHPNPQRTRGTHHGRPDADRRSVGDAGTPNAGGRSLRTKVADTQRSEAHSRPMSLYFYNHDEPYFEFTNFSNHAIVFDNQQYATAEHLFQAFKFLEHHPNIGQLIRDQPTPRRAREEAGRLRRLQRSDWFDINIEVMDRVLALKFEQHPRLARMLVDTGNAALVEDSPDDVFWGVGKDRLGRNELGKALMRLRSKLATG